MKTPVDQLTNDQLDRLCAEFQGLVILPKNYHPTTDGAQFMDLLEKYKIEPKHYHGIGWNAYCPVNAYDGFGRGETASLVGCRAFVDAMTKGQGVER